MFYAAFAFGLSDAILYDFYGEESPFLFKQFYEAALGK